MVVLMLYTQGMFTILSEAKKLGDILIIGLNTDDSVKRLKGEHRPINNQFRQSERVECT